MSESTSNNPVYTIEVGTPGTYTNDGSLDVSQMVNAEIKAAPNGAQIDLIFNPGNYGVSHTILLPSNTSVVGNDATLSIINNPLLSMNGGAIMANADAYYVGNNLTDNNDDGTTTTIPYVSNSTVTMTTNSSTAIVDSNISIKGLVFNETGNSLGGTNYINKDKNTNMFGTWFTNAENIDIENNVYIGGNDGNAFVNVVNGIVANNIAVGQLAAIDNWDGPVNITIEDNSIWQFSANELAPAASIQINSTPTGDPNNSGTANNIGIIDNLSAGNSTSYDSAINTWPLPGYSPTLVPTYDVTQQGNIISGLNTPDIGPLYMDDTTGSTTQDNILSQFVEPSTLNLWGQTITNTAIVNINFPGAETSNGIMSGNLILGDYTSGTSTPVFLDQGQNSELLNNAVLGQSSLESNAFIANTIVGNIDNSGTVLLGTISSPTLDIIAPAEIFINSFDSIFLSGSLASTIADSDPLVNESVTLSTQFGTLSIVSMVETTHTTVNGEASIILTGSLPQIDSELQSLTYTPNISGWSDSIKVVVWDSVGATTTRYIPIVSDIGTTTISNVTTIAPGFVNATAIESMFSGQILPSTPTFSGNILIASTGDNAISMGSISSLAFLGAGKTTLQGGSLAEFIETGSGQAVLNLNGTGDITVAGGAGSLQINADNSIASVADFIETGASNATINGGAEEMSIAGGLGTVRYRGGSGTTYITTLPQDGGGLFAALGSGNSTVFALSGVSTISTEQETNNYIFLGAGYTSITSGGNDNIYAGNGILMLSELSESYDTIHLGSGIVNYIDDTSTLSNTSSSGVSQTGGIAIAGAGCISVSGANMPMSFEQTKTGDFILAEGSAYILGADLNDTIFGGNGSLVYNQGEGLGNILVKPEAGGGSIILTAGIDTVLSSTGSCNVTADGATAVLLGLGEGGGEITAVSVGSSSITTQIGATDQITLSQVAGDKALITSCGSDAISVTGNVSINARPGSNDSIVARNATLNCSVGSPTQYGMANSTIDLTDGQATVSVFNMSTTKVQLSQSDLEFINRSIMPQVVSGGSGGSVTVFGGAGGGVYSGGSGGSNSLIGGGGVVTLIGSGSGDVLMANSPVGQNELVSGSGSETLSASSSTDANCFIVAGKGQDIVTSDGAGIQSFMLQQSSGGTSTIVGSSIFGALNLFNVPAANNFSGGSYTIDRFNPIQSLLDFNNIDANGAITYTLTSISDYSIGTDHGCTILLSNNTQVNLAGVSSSSLVVNAHLPGGFTIS